MPVAIVVGTEDDLRKGSGKRALTTTQAAAYLGVGERMVRKWVENGVLTPYEERLFHIPIFLADEIEEFRQSRLKMGY